MKIVLFILIVITNSVFVITWLIGIIEAYAIFLSDKNPKLSKWICFCFWKSRRFHRFATSLGIDMKNFDVELGPEPEERNT